ncbi:hypothetical protein K9M16_04170 [Candidatus Babeliales bacterium]|nr:hypothetical protein [Candidatus Babeliales bacterium]
MIVYDQSIKKGAKILVQECGRVTKTDKVLIIVDDQTKLIGELLSEIALSITQNTKLIISKNVNQHGSEPEEEIAELMKHFDIIFGLTKSSIAHTNARKDASAIGARYLSLPDYSFEQLSSPALEANFVRQAKIAYKIKKILDKGKIVNIKTDKGTDLDLLINGRIANFCPGFCALPGMLGSPPDIETNVAPVENKSNGVLVVDGSIPCIELGLIKKDIKVIIKNGHIENIICDGIQAEVLKNVFEKQNNLKTKVLAEFGIGLNPKAKLCGRMLEDEGCLGTIHFGFGSNSTIGGLNEVGFHLDFVIKKATVLIDDFLLIKGGDLLIS